MLFKMAIKKNLMEMHYLFVNWLNQISIQG